MSQHAKFDPRSETAAGVDASSGTTPSAADVKRWRQYLADERAEAAVYRDLAQSRTGEERATTVHSEATRVILDRVGRRPGHIFNLGHGMLPDTDPAVARAVVELVHEYTQREGTG